MSNEKEKSRITFDKQAETYDTDAGFRHARRMYSVLLNKLSNIPYHSALDIGCGTGEMLRLILEQDGSKQLTGLDLSERMLDIAKAKLTPPGGVVLVQGDSEHLPFQDNSFDLVYCNSSFHHYPAPDRVLAEIRRVLKSGGTFVMGDPWRPFGWRNMINLYLRFLDHGDVKFYSKRELCALFAEHFRDVQWENVGLHSCVAQGTK